MFSPNFLYADVFAAIYRKIRDRAYLMQVEYGSPSMNRVVRRIEIIGTR